MTAAQRRLLGPAILILLALIPVWRAVLLGEAIGPVDHIRAMVDPSAPRPETPWNVLQADSLLQFRTWRSLVFEGWSQGQIPVWNPYSLLGTPLLANSQSGALYPFHILAGVLRLDVDRAIGLLAWLHLSLAGIGTFRLCRGLGTDRVSALFGGSAFMLSAFLLAWTPLASVPTTVAWIPWALFWVARRDWRWLSVSLAMMLLGGHLQFAVYGLVAVLVFTLAQGAWRMLPALALGGALAAAHMLPVLDFGQYSHRRTPPTAEGYAAYSKSALQLWQLGTVAAPDAYGVPQKPGLKAGETQLPTYWPSTVKLGENFAEAAVGLSPVAFVLLGVVPWRKRQAWSVGLVALFGFLLAMPTAFAQGLYFSAPGWSATGSPGRAVALFVLGGSILAALGLHRLRERTSETSRDPRLLAALAGAAVLALALTFGLSSLTPPSALGLDADSLSAMRSSATLSALVPALGLIFALILLYSPTVPRRFSPLAAALPALYAVATYAPGLIPTGRMPDLPSAEPGTRIAVVNDRWNLFATPRAILPPNLLAAARIVDTGGYDSLLDAETKRTLDAANRAESPPAENGNMMFIKPTVDFGALQDLGVSELWAKEPIEGLSVMGAWNNIVRHHIGGHTTFTPRSGTHRLTGPKLTLNSITTDEVSQGKVRAIWRNLPGWTMNGKPVDAGTFLVADAPAGGGPATFLYTPPGLRTGLAISGLAVLVLLAGFALPRLRKGSENTEEAAP